MAGVPRPRRGSVAYWVAVVLVYALAATLYPPVALLGFWQSAPWLLLAHLTRPHVLRALGVDPGPAPVRPGDAGPGGGEGAG